MNKSIRVNVGYYHFKFDNVEEAIKFAETAINHGEKEDLDVDIEIEFENNKED